MELDKRPVCPPSYAYAGPPPVTKSIKVRRTACGKDTVFNARYRHSTQPATVPPENQGSCKQNWQSWGIVHTQAASGAMRASFMQRAAALVDGIDPGHLRLIWSSG